jgi:brachyury protein
MQALKDVLEGGSPTVAWSVVQAAISEQQERREIVARGDAVDAPSSSPSPPRELGYHAGQLQEDPPRILLDSAPLWRQFFSATNEMIVTKAGRRMFPVLKLHVSRLEMTAMYAVVLEFRCTHQHRWRFLNGNWQKGSTCEDNADLRHVFVHFASVAPGSQWMQEPVSFAKLKLSNRENGTSKIKLNSLHKYQPYIHVIKIASNGKQQPLEITTFTFPETQFIAVTAYQNDKARYINSYIHGIFHEEHRLLGEVQR